MSEQKRHRDAQRRFLHKRGWVAVDAVKRNGAFKNAWIHHTQQGSYSREDAVILSDQFPEVIVKPR